MGKLFEIPVYAMDEGTLNERYILFSEKFRRECIPSEASEETIRRCIEIAAFPQRLWQYNHIVGYIMIRNNGCDIEFNVYLPTPKIEKYYWKSKRKKFLYDINANGAHFRLEENYTSDDIRKEIAEMLYEIIKEHISRNYYVDLECFEILNQNIDYKKMLLESKATESGEKR